MHAIVRRIRDRGIWCVLMTVTWSDTAAFPASNPTCVAGKQQLNDLIISMDGESGAKVCNTLSIDGEAGHLDNEWRTRRQLRLCVPAFCFSMSGVRVPSHTSARGVCARARFSVGTRRSSLTRMISGILIGFKPQRPWVISVRSFLRSPAQSALRVNQHRTLTPSGSSGCLKRTAPSSSCSSLTRLSAISIIGSNC